LVTFFFSFHKEKKKVTKRFEIKEKLQFKIKEKSLNGVPAKSQFLQFYSQQS